jgi:predicted NBD/HSP70 family sugar kinase
MIRAATQLTRRDLERRTGLSASQISRLTGELIALGVITADGRADTVTGRPSDLLTLADEGRYVVGLDIGGGIQRAAFVNLRGDVLTSLVRPVPSTTDQDKITEAWVSLIKEVVAAACRSMEAVIGIGVGVRAIVDPTSGIVSGWPDTPAWSAAIPSFAVRDKLAAHFPARQLVVDDTVRALAVTEARYGLGRKESDFVFVLADSGIGATIMIGGRPYIGPNHLAGELGHIALGTSSRRCGCGKIGCIETMASATSLVARARSSWPAPDLSVADLIAAGAEGHAEARRVLIEGGEHLGLGMAILLNLLSPRLIVVSGVLASSALYLEVARQTMLDRALPQATREIRLAAAPLDPLAGARGAATLALDALFDPSPTDRPARLRRPRHRTRSLSSPRDDMSAR